MAEVKNDIGELKNLILKKGGKGLNEMKEEKKFQRKCKICGKDFFSDQCNTLYCPTCRNTKIIKNEHVGERFGKLTVLRDYSLNGKRYAECKCGCGKVKTINYNSLRTGSTTSCGCAHILDVPNLINKYGVKAIKRTNKRNGLDMFLCKCPRCGKEFEVLQNNFWKNKSCGCIFTESRPKNMANGWKNVTSKGLEDGTQIFYLFSGENQKNNTSGTRGVYYNKKIKKWCASICFKRKSIYLGSYEKKEDAIAARKEVEKNIYGKFIEEFKENYPDRWEIIEKTHKKSLEKKNKKQQK